MEDVAEAVANILTDPGTIGQTYELAGPGVYTLRELVTMTSHLMRKRRLLIPVPFAVTEIQARLLNSCQTHRSPPARLIFSKRMTLRAEPCRVCKSSRFNRKRSRKWCRRTLVLGHQDLTDQ